MLVDVWKNNVPDTNLELPLVRTKYSLELQNKLVNYKSHINRQRERYREEERGDLIDNILSSYDPYSIAYLLRLHF